MDRRASTLLISSVLLVVVTFFAFVLPLPYVIESPGVTENVLGTYKGKEVITITGHKTYPVKGHLNLTTVLVTRADYKPRLAGVFKAWVDPDEAVIPRDAYYPPDQSVKQSRQQDVRDMLDSQSSAIAAGLRRAGYQPIVPTVGKVTPGSPVAGVVESGDGILAVDGASTPTANALVSALSAKKPGTRVKLTIRRDFRDRTVAVVTEANPDKPGKSRIGVTIGDDFNPPFKVSVKLGQQIGGPSGGLMFSLAIYDKLTPGALTGGRFIAGTGTIDQDGKVGPIGGIQQKIVSAQRDGATIFLVPSGNCSDALRSPGADKIELVKVASLSRAVSAVETLAADSKAKVPSCS
jgi:PDZ domain-containing protein